MVFFGAAGHASLAATTAPKIFTEGATDYLAAIGPLRFTLADVIGFPGTPAVRKGIEELIKSNRLGPADEIVIAFDGDPAGEKAAIEAAETLSKAGISTRRLRTPEPHKDLCEWCAAIPAEGGDPAARILAAIQNSELQDPFSWAIPASEFVERAPKEIPWHVRGLVPRGAFVLIVSAPGVGKTWLAILLAAAVSRGEPTLGGLETSLGRVALVEEEGAESALADRLKILNAANDNILVIHQAGVAVDEEAWVERLISLCRVRKVSMIILDPLADLHSGDENESKAVREVVRAVNCLRREVEGLTVVLLHHVPKSAYEATEGHRSHARGSGALVGAADVQIELIEIEPAEHEGEYPDLAFRLEVVKARDYDKPAPTECALFVGDERAEWKFIPAPRSAKAVKESPTSLDDRVYASIPEDGTPISVEKLRGALHIRMTTARESVDRLIKRQLITRTRQGISRKPASESIVEADNWRLNEVPQ